MVPEGWIESTFGDVAEFRNGLNFSIDDAGEAVQIVGVGDFKNHSVLTKTDNLATIRIKNEVRNADLIKDGDLLFVRSNGNKALIGRCLYFPKVSGRLSFSGFTIRGRVDSKVLKPDYASHLARSEAVKRQISQSGGGTNISNLSQRILSDIQLIYPEVDEQEKIVQILSKWDRAIEITEKLIANSELQKKALMQQLLTGKRRLQGFEGDWGRESFSKLFDLKIGGTPSRNNPKYWSPDSSEGHIWIAIRDLKRKYIEDSKERITDLGVKNSNVKPLSPNTLIFSFKLSIGKVAIITRPAYTNEAICALVPLDVEHVNSVFVYHMLGHMDLEATVDQAVKGKTLNKAKISELIMRLPSLQEQQAVSNVLEIADRQTTALQEKRLHLLKEKTSLMQQLLTGKRRVKIEEAENA